MASGQLFRLQGFSFTSLQGGYFQFKLPSYPKRISPVTRARDTVKNQIRDDEMKVFQIAGTAGVMALKLERTAHRHEHDHGLKRLLRARGTRKVTNRTGQGETGTLVAYPS